MKALLYDSRDTTQVGNSTRNTQNVPRDKNKERRSLDTREYIFLRLISLGEANHLPEGGKRTHISTLKV